MRGVRHPRCVAMPLTPRPRAPPLRAQAAVREVMKAAPRRGVALLARMGASGRAPAPTATTVTRCMWEPCLTANKCARHPSGNILCSLLYARSRSVGPPRRSSAVS